MPTALLCLFAVFGTDTSAAAPKPKVAILPFRVVRMAADLAPALDSHLVGAIDARNRYDVITPEDINALLGLERMKDAINCSDTACAAELGGALGVEYLISAQATALGDMAEITITLIDVHHANVSGRKQGRVPNQERFLAKGIDEAVDLLIGPEEAALPEADAMPLRVTTNNLRGYEVHIDSSGGSMPCANLVTHENPCVLRVPRQAVELVATPTGDLFRPLVHMNLAPDSAGYNVELNGSGNLAFTALGGMGLGLGLMGMVSSTLAFVLNDTATGFTVLGSGIALAGLGGYALYVGFPVDTSSVSHGVRPL